MMLFRGAINWKASLQKTVMTSSTEVELLTVTLTACETMVLQRFFADLRFDSGELYRIFCDHQQTIRLVAVDNQRIVTKLRHVDIDNI
jgi:hypothetical protein